MGIAGGWAAVHEDGDIVVSTVSPTRRGAIVNWLVTVPKVMVTNRHSDDDIDSLFQLEKQHYRVDIVSVTIKVGN